ncbi:ABC transporter ATP-binding protein [Hyphococcus sp.]|jgi:ABC-type polysaccharide/polyol phosphate transport system ATPase subunit|uniref:ABC transporter ATP-binding protein n=1 Tax=Hyphococcus sp. TaxID=2038636 RepID=UPI003D121D9B
MLREGELVLSVEDVWKRYASSTAASQKHAGAILWDAFAGFGVQPGKVPPGEKNVLCGVNFTLRRGEALGVIGFNGSGKTTLLRLLAGHILPDQGQVRIAGETGAMIDLTAGIKDTMTGRANIYLRSAIIGRKREEVAANIEEIISFTELGAAIDAPVYTYSAGMRMRLAFATTVFMNPDLLLVDEVLSVGDFKFRQKCLERIRALRQHSAFVLVSHSMNDISRFCDKVIVLEKGSVVFSGEPDEGIAFYHRAAEKKAPAKAPRMGNELGDFIHKEHALADVFAEWRNSEGAPCDKVTAGGQAFLSLKFTPLRPMRNLIIGVPIFSKRGEMLTALSSDQMQIKLDHEVGAPMEVEIEVSNLPLTPGAYRAVVAIVDGPEFLYRQQIGDITVYRGNLPKYWGDFVMSQKWTTKS